MIEKPERNYTASDTDIAWCAGFFDGEGHVSYRRGYPSKSGNVSGVIHASIPQNSENIEVLEFFQSVIGFGRIKGPYSMPGKSKDQHRLLFGINEVEILFGILKPYLRKDKSSNFIEAITKYYTHSPIATAEDYGRRVRWQKKKGCPRCKEGWNGVMCMSCGYM